MCETKVSWAKLRRSRIEKLDDSGTARPAGQAGNKYLDCNTEQWGYPYRCGQTFELVRYPSPVIMTSCLFVLPYFGGMIASRRETLGPDFSPGIVDRVLSPGAESDNRRRGHPEQLITVAADSRQRVLEAWNGLVEAYADKIDQLDAAVRLDVLPFPSWLRGRIAQDQLRGILQAVFSHHWDTKVANKRNETAYRIKAATHLGLDSHWDLYLFFGHATVASRTCWLNLPHNIDALALFSRLLRVRGTSPNYLRQLFRPREFTIAKKAVNPAPVTLTKSRGKEIINKASSSSAAAATQGQAQPKVNRKAVDTINRGSPDHDRTPVRDDLREQRDHRFRPFTTGQPTTDITSDIDQHQVGRTDSVSNDEEECHTPQEFSCSRTNRFRDREIASHASDDDDDAFQDSGFFSGMGEETLRPGTDTGSDAERSSASPRKEAKEDTEVQQVLDEVQQTLARLQAIEEQTEGCIDEEDEWCSISKANAEAIGSQQQIDKDMALLVRRKRVADRALEAGRAKRPRVREASRWASQDNEIRPVFLKETYVQTLSRTLASSLAGRRLRVQANRQVHSHRVNAPLSSSDSGGDGGPSHQGQQDDWSSSAKTAASCALLVSAHRNPERVGVNSSADVRIGSVASHVLKSPYKGFGTVKRQLQASPSCIDSRQNLLHLFGSVLTMTIPIIMVIVGGLQQVHFISKDIRGTSLPAS
ncbi:uncharacterized protein LY79DRAFT_662755 [Colletotrichum navitas]|uniref:Uncharacterized protein n=1 Tax=Colletotrichum navitas TaxID=681940 RepID=A0AAD8UZB5_9PEZI|nr:uncharacterized protein LY79DRAFT_662755 [Colletotrichum navitas]KAK1573477.1 hypothetical protein LY79DRAFT_662755 [Colletotrichum navitas]